MAAPLVDLLLAKGARVEAVDGEDKTALHHLCERPISQKRAPEIGAALIGARPGLVLMRDTKGRTPLMHASMKKASGLPFEVLAGSKVQVWQMVRRLSAALEEQASPPEAAAAAGGAMPQASKDPETPLVEMMNLLLQAMDEESVREADREGMVSLPCRGEPGGVGWGTGRIHNPSESARVSSIETRDATPIPAPPACWFVMQTALDYSIMGYDRDIGVARLLLEKAPPASFSPKLIQTALSWGNVSIVRLLNLHGIGPQLHSNEGRAMALSARDSRQVRTTFALLWRLVRSSGNTT